MTECATAARNMGHSCSSTVTGEISLGEEFHQVVVGVALYGTRVADANGDKIVIILQL